MRAVAIIVAGAALFIALPAQAQFPQPTEMPPVCRNLAWGTQDIAKCIALGGIERPHKHRKAPPKAK